jgi:prophage regulatory protein
VLTNDSTSTGERLLSPKEVIKRTSLSRTTLWRLSRRGDFPKPISLSPGRRGWPESAVAKWISDRIGAAA